MDSHHGNPPMLTDPKLLQCHICKVVFYNPTSVKPCFHVFCSGCISNWFKTNRSCPLCRAQASELAFNEELNEHVDNFLRENPSSARCDEEKLRLDKFEFYYLLGAVVESRVNMGADNLNNGLMREKDRRLSERLLQLNNRITDGYRNRNTGNGTVHHHEATNNFFSFRKSDDVELFSTFAKTPEDSLYVVSFQNSPALCFPVSRQQQAILSFPLSKRLVEGMRASQGVLREIDSFSFERSRPQGQISNALDTRLEIDARAEEVVPRRSARLRKREARN